MALGDVWGNGWGSSWGTSWGQAVAAVAVPQTVSGGFAQYLLERPGRRHSEAISLAIDSAPEQLREEAASIIDLAAQRGARRKASATKAAAAERDALRSALERASIVYDRTYEDALSAQIECERWRMFQEQEDAAMLLLMAA